MINAKNAKIMKNLMVPIVLHVEKAKFTTKMENNVNAKTEIPLVLTIKILVVLKLNANKIGSPLENVIYNVQKIKKWRMINVKNVQIINLPQVIIQLVNALVIKLMLKKPVNVKRTNTARKLFLTNKLVT